MYSHYHPGSVGGPLAAQGLEAAGLWGGRTT